MRIVLELDQTDLERFDAMLVRTRRRVGAIDEVEVVDAAKYAIDHLDMSTAPAFVRKRIAEVQRLIAMLEDEAWALPEPERREVVGTLAYFSDPDDLIPDQIEVIGLIDDAIALELLLRRLRHVRKAYAAFCAFRLAYGDAGGDAGARHEQARCLAQQRARLQAAMRRQGRRVAGTS